MTAVKCTVDECVYWEDNVCTADEIEVKSVFSRQDDPDLELADFKSTGASSTSEDTMCETFRPGR